MHEKVGRLSFPTKVSFNNFDPYVDWGGPVIPNVKIVMIRWGAIGDYASYITRQNITQSMSSFYTEIVKSSWIDWLSEYNTDTQNIGRGTFGGYYTITPSHYYSTVTDNFIMAELVRQINNGTIPANDDNTLYMLHFPKNVVISAYGMLSCVDFCAYHSTIALPSPALYYAVIPDFSSVSGCNWGCGGGTEFANVCAVSSHEIGEAITDPAVGFAFEYAPPLTWYSPSYDEIGDMCNGVQGTFMTANGTKYVIQKMGSNRARNCIENCISGVSLSQSMEYYYG